MKKALLLFALFYSVICLGQDYKNDWIKVIQYETDGEVKQAAAITDKIYLRAKKDRNEPQLIKAFFFKSKYLQTLQEDAQLKIISTLKQDIKMAGIPAKAIMESLYAGMLQDIYERNRYDIRSRSDIKAPQEETYLSWSENNFKDEITAAYNRSIEKRDVLYATPLEKYDLIIDFNALLAKTNRSLYDFLAERYLDYMLASAYNLNLYKPEEAAYLLGDENQFQKAAVKDTATIRPKIGLLLCQQTEAFYIQKKDTYSLQRAVLRRLAYASRQIGSPDIYLATVTQLARQWEGSPFAYRAKLKQAQLYNSLATKTKTSDYKIKALAVCNDIIANASKNDVTFEAASLKNTLINQTSTLYTEKYIAPNAPSLAKISFRNLDSVRISFYKIPQTFASKGRYYFSSNDSIVKNIKNKTAVTQKVYALPNRHDYFDYETELILPPVPQGCYLIVISAANNAPDDADDKNLFAFSTVQACNTTLLDRQDNNLNLFQLANRETGAPALNATAISGGKIFTSDAWGRIFIPTGDKMNNKEAMFIHNGDTLTKSFYNYSYTHTEEDVIGTIQLYLDRAIYRPGQTAFFKGILMQDKKGVFSTVPNEYVSITVDDSNGNAIKQFRLKTNEYGSVNSEFILPPGMTGEFTLKADEDDTPDETSDEDTFWDIADFNDASLDFRVEEYKRPTFAIHFKPVKEDIRVNEKVTVTGIAKSFSGAPIANAEVEYRIERKSRSLRYPYSRYYRDDHEIDSSDTITDANGNFVITFEAEADDEYEPDELPVFQYTVYADVTDSNGETHTSNYVVYAGYHSLDLQVNMPYTVDIDKGADVSLNSENLNGQFMPAEGEVKIYRFAAPNRVLSTRPWRAPEVQLISEAEFVKNFPHLPYGDVKDSVIKQKAWFTQKVNTAKSKTLKLNNFKGWESGRYQLVFTAKDSLGNDVEATAQFTLASEKNNHPSDNKVFTSRILNTNFAKDGYVKVELLTSLPKAYANIIAYTNNKSIYDKQVIIEGGKTIIKIPVVKNPRTVMNINTDLVWQNEFFSQSLMATVLREHETLKVATQAMDSKLEPGSNHRWTFTVTGSKASSEVLASMYDASLDQLAKDDWRNLNTNTYGSNSTRTKSMETGGNENTAFDNKKQAKGEFINPGDSFYTYGFDILKKNVYSQYNPKKQVPGKKAYTIKGVVTSKSDGMPLPGAPVILEGTSEGTVTDIDGNYIIYASKGERVVFAYIGYKTKYLAITANAIVDIALEDDFSTLNEVVVVGYGTTRKESSTGSITTTYSVGLNYEGNISTLLQGKVAGVSILNGNGAPGSETTIRIRGAGSVNGEVQPLYIIDGAPLSEEAFASLNASDILDVKVLKNNEAMALYGAKGANGVVIITTKKALEALQQVKARKNFNETAFFFPQLTTDKKGNFSFSFTTPEALTEWKLRLLAHNKNAASTAFEKSFITQKQLMVVPNMPRFLREKDTVVIFAKITNMTSEPKTGSALLQLFDAMSMEPADTQMLNTQNIKPFVLAPNASTTVSWKISVPTGLQGVQYKILAKAGDFTDGEENIVPVLTNSMLITESLPVWVKPNSTKSYTFDNLKNNTSATLRNQGITLEYTSNPAWVALQSLPYLIEFEHECAEQVFSRFYANAIASHIINSNPKIAGVFAAWRAAGKPLNKLEQNEELKSIILAETPWMLDTENEDEKKNRLALLFDLDKMKAGLEANFKKLNDKQLDSGGFAWFGGTTANDYVTRHILAGFGHLNQLNIKLPDSDNVNALTKRGINYTDEQFIKSYKTDAAWRKKNKSFRIVSSYSDMHYLYMRSFYLKQYPLKDSLAAAAKLYVNTVKNNWLTYSLYEKGMAALVLNRFGDTATAKKVINNLRETSSLNEEWGMYWIENRAGWYWYRAPIETQALLIEAFMEVDNDVKSVDAMKVWLIKNKQNKNWPTTKSTTEAVYALLMQGTDWLSVKDNTTITLGDYKLLAKKMAENAPEAGTGYIKLNWKPEEVTKSMATLTVQNKSAVPGFGGFYWQYFEELDKIKPAQEGIMNITKELYFRGETGNAPPLRLVTKDTPLKIGDLVTVRLVLNIKEDVEFVHLKDMRAAAFEPVDVLSGYEHSDGLWYYQSTRDVATHFFFDYINRGTYILEYQVRVNNAGEFSNGITTIQSMYAPEFSGHSVGTRVKTGE